MSLISPPEEGEEPLKVEGRPEGQYAVFMIVPHEWELLTGGDATTYISFLNYSHLSVHR